MNKTEKIAKLKAELERLEGKNPSYDKSLKFWKKNFGVELKESFKAVCPKSNKSYTCFKTNKEGLDLALTRGNKVLAKKWF